VVVVEALLRNYPPRSAVCIRWDAGRFDVAEVSPVPMTSRSRNQGDTHGKSILAYVARHPQASRREVARAVGCGVATAQRWMDKADGGGS